MQKLKIKHSIEVWRRLILERMLVRIYHSKYSDKFIFKGGLLLSHYLDIGRETKDIDFLATLMDVTVPNIEIAFNDICAVNMSDSFIFSFSNMTKLEQPHMNYPGYRVNLNLKFGKMKDRIHVDVGVGDIVEPNQESLELYQYNGKPIFEGAVSLRVYPVETIFTEKLESIISKGAVNSRMKDYHDLLLLCREKDFLNIHKLKSNISKTFEHRKTNLTIPLYFSEDDYFSMQKLWVGHRRGLGEIAVKLNIPEKIKNLVSEINVWLIKNNL
ncbi:nucleotidyl transferase AbiEii/AbiGii toxin family protein [Candidatus Halobeggiatoa sp. HSG11]|nr:nucleotidyl transferase AbiEii/AbiGii toxin family protein [Candidatus Halobeggiatoa sp. HSG11]